MHASQLLRSLDSNPHRKIQYFLWPSQHNNNNQALWPLYRSNQVVSSILQLELDSSRLRVEGQRKEWLLGV